jgi:hypothetical protein
MAKVSHLSETLLTKFPKIDAPYFHNYDMALAAYDVMKAPNRTNIKIGGCDAMPTALQAMMDGRMVATLRNSSCLIPAPAPSRRSSGYLHRNSFTDRQKRAGSYCGSEHYLIDVLMGSPALIRIFCVREPKVDHLVA